jgi:hypothetical protein
LGFGGDGVRAFFIIAREKEGVLRGFAGLWGCFWGNGEKWAVNEEMAIDGRENH